MSAPDRIHAVPSKAMGWKLGYCSTTHEGTEYIRADLVPQWMPIETAPDFGVSFIGAYRTKTGTWIAEVVTFEAKIITSSGKPFPSTHWQPLPSPPPAS